MKNLGSDQPNDASDKVAERRNTTRTDSLGIRRCVARARRSFFAGTVAVTGLFVSIISPNDPTMAGEPNSLTRPATEDDIARLIRDLGNRSYETRTSATRRLCAIGMRARRQLESAAGANDAEIALRADRIVSSLDRLLFAGVDVALTFSKPSVSWNEPVALRVTLTNRSDYATRVPFETDPEKRKALSEDARQVGDMLDVAEWLHVRRLNGSALELRVDNILDDAAVGSEVNRRLNGGPESILQPGKEITIVAEAFNRGWSRYALLDRGTYEVVFRYEPLWEDQHLRAAGVGKVESHRATITVTSSAPEAVSRKGLEASLAIHLEGDSAVALVTNRTDRRALINKNFGRAEPFARGHWVYARRGTRHETPVFTSQRASWHDFDMDLVVSVEPGQSVEVARASIKHLRKTFAETGADVAAANWELLFTYVNLLNRHWQTRQALPRNDIDDASPLLRTHLPRGILTTRLTSNPLVAPVVR